MAQKTVTQLTDDLDGTPIEEGDGETVNLTFRGQSYELDLSNKNLVALDKALEKYLAVGRKTSAPSTRRSTSSRTSSGSDIDPKEVRAWAEKSGVEVSARGRIKAETLEQYKKAQG